MRVLMICDEDGVSEFFRVTTPYRLLAAAGEIEVEFDSGSNPAVIDHLEEFDAVVFSRPDTPEELAILLEARSRGLRTVVDVDDNLLLIPPSIGHYYAWHQRGSGRITSRLWYFKRCIKLADVLTVSTSALGRQMCDGDPHRLRAEGDYMVLENCILADDWLPGVGGQGMVKGPGEVWVGWWGIYNHWDDFRDIAWRIDPVIASRPHVKLVLLGMPELVHLFPVLRKSNQLIVGPFVKVDELGPYREMVRQFDVALAPTADCPFNEAKSDLKVLQYGAAGVPVIASAVTYRAWKGFATIIAEPAGWTAALEWMLTHPAQTRRDAQRLQAQVMATRTYERNHWRWLEALGEHRTTESSDAGQHRCSRRETPAAIVESGEAVA